MDQVLQHRESRTLGHVNNRTARRIQQPPTARPLPIQAREDPAANPIDGNGQSGKNVVFDPGKDLLNTLNALSGIQ